MAAYIYNTATGTLVSWVPNDTDPVAPAGVLASNGLTAITGLPALDSTHAWDPTTKTVITVIAPTPPKPLPLVNWVFRFTAAELDAIRASSDPAVRKFMFLLPLGANQLIDLSQVFVQNAIANMVTLGLLTQARANVILS